MRSIALAALWLCRKINDQQHRAQRQSGCTDQDERIAAGPLQRIDKLRRVRVQCGSERRVESRAAEQDHATGQCCGNAPPDPSGATHAPPLSEQQYEQAAEQQYGDGEKDARHGTEQHLEHRQRRSGYLQRHREGCAAGEHSVELRCQLFAQQRRQRAGLFLAGLQRRRQNAGRQLRQFAGIHRRHLPAANERIDRVRCELAGIGVQRGGVCAGSIQTHLAERILHDAAHQSRSGNGFGKRFGRNQAVGNKQREQTGLQNEQNDSEQDRRKGSHDFHPINSSYHEVGGFPCGVPPRPRLLRQPCDIRNRRIQKHASGAAGYTSIDTAQFIELLCCCQPRRFPQHQMPVGLAVQARKQKGLAILGKSP